MKIMKILLIDYLKRIKTINFSFNRHLIFLKLVSVHVDPLKQPKRLYLKALMNYTQDFTFPSLLSVFTELTDAHSLMLPLLVLKPIVSGVPDGKVSNFR